MKKPNLFIIQINLSGLHDVVYELHWDNERQEYWDQEGNIDFDPNKKPNRNLIQLSFKSLKDAQCALKGAQMVRTFYKSHF